MHQGLEWRREEPSWTELGKLKEQAGTSQVAVMNRAIKIKDEKDDNEGRGEAATCCYPIVFFANFSLIVGLGWYMMQLKCF